MAREWLISITCFDVFSSFSSCYSDSIWLNVTFRNNIPAMSEFRPPIYFCYYVLHVISDNCNL